MYDIELLVSQCEVKDPPLMLALYSVEQLGNKTTRIEQSV